MESLDIEEPDVSGDHSIKLRVEGVPSYFCKLKFDRRSSGPAQMTVLLFVIDLIKERVGITKMENKETSVNFDEENLTTFEEILQTKMEEVLIRRAGTTNPFNDVLDAALDETDVIYLNHKD